MVHFTALIVAAFTVLPIFAHPGHDVEAEAAEREAYRRSPDYQSLAPCAAEIKARDHKMIQRRIEQVRQIQQKRGLERRSLTDVLNKDHKSTKAVTPSSPTTDIFGSNSSCILQPETTEGPYCEYLRRQNERF